MLNFFNTIPLPTIIVNKENLIIFINELGNQFLELTSDNFSSQSITSLFPELELSALKNKKEFNTTYTSFNKIQKKITVLFDSCVIENQEYRLFYIKDFSFPSNFNDSLYSNKKNNLNKEKLYLSDFFLNQINDGVLVFNTLGQLVYRNKSTLLHFKLSNKKLKNNFAWELENLFESKLDWENKKTLIYQGQQIPIVTSICTDLNKEYTLSGLMQFQNIEQNDYYIFTYTDVSESISNRKFNDSVLFNLPADIAVFDKNHNYIFINPNGIRNEEIRNWMIGKNDFDYYKLKNLDSKPAEQRRAYFNQAKETKQEVDWLDEIVKGDKKTFVLRRFYPYYINDVFVYMIGYGIDITELKQTQSELSETQKQNELILKSSPDGVILIDNNWKITYWNPQAKEIFGWNSEEVIGSYLPEIIFPIAFGNNFSMDLFKSEVFSKTNGNSNTLEINAFKKDGKKLTIELSLVTLDEHENSYNYCVFITDISFRKEKEVKIQQQNKLLLSQNKELEQFTYVASHDLQEPLLSLISYSKLLEEEYEDKLDDEGKMFVQFINKSALRMRSLISGLMQYARINKREDLEKIDLQILLQEVQEDLSNTINKNGALITIDELPSLYCYPTYVRLLFQNLISNAVKFTKKEVVSEIYISYTERENDWLFQIKDNGIGIAEKNLEEIFMIFKRLHSEQNYIGHGIGLAHCKKIVEIHNGEIWVESVIGEGSIFNFTISKNI